MAEQDPPSPVLDYASPKERLRWTRFIPTAIVSILIIGLLLGTLLPIRSGGDRSPRVACMSNLRQIGLGLVMYCNANGGRYPDDLSTLLLSQGTNPKSLVCPSSKDTPAKGATTQA